MLETGYIAVQIHFTLYVTHDIYVPVPRTAASEIIRLIILVLFTILSCWRIRQNRPATRNGSH